MHTLPAPAAGSGGVYRRGGGYRPDGGFYRSEPGYQVLNLVTRFWPWFSGSPWLPGFGGFYRSDGSDGGQPPPKR